MQFISLQSTANGCYMLGSPPIVRNITTKDLSSVTNLQLRNTIKLLYIIQRSTYPLLGDQGCTRPSGDQGSLERACLTLHAAKCPAPTVTNRHALMTLITCSLQTLVKMSIPKWVLTENPPLTGVCRLFSYLFVTVQLCYTDGTINIYYKVPKTQICFN